MSNDSTGYNNDTKGSIAFLAAASYMAGPIARHFKEAGYSIVALVRPSTDCSAIVDEGLVLEHEIYRGDLSDKEFVTMATKGCVAIINFLSQLMPPCVTIKEQVENDLPPLKAALEAALEHDAIFIHTSGNFAIPTAGMDVITNELPEKPLGASLLDEESWSTFEHEGGMTAVAVLAEAKHREDHAVQDFIAQHPASKARVVIPAGIYGPSVGRKFSFWDLAAHLYLTEQFGDFLHAFVHINDAARVYQAVMERGERGERYPVYGETMTVCRFTAVYAKVCSVPFLADSPKCSEKEAARIYDDSATRAQFGIEYQHSIEKSLPAAIAHLRERGILMVVAQQLEPATTTEAA